MNLRLYGRNRIRKFKIKSELGNFYKYIYIFWGEKGDRNIFNKYSENYILFILS